MKFNKGILVFCSHSGSDDGTEFTGKGKILLPLGEGKDVLVCRECFKAIQEIAVADLLKDKFVIKMKKEV